MNELRKTMDKNRIDALFLRKNRSIMGEKPEKGDVAMYLILMAVWLILNGRVTLEICIFGVVISTALFVFLCRFLDYSLRRELLLYRLVPFGIRYFFALVEEIVKANVCVLRIITSLELQPEPALVYFDAHFRTGLAKVLLANSITLTPGTITVSVEGDHYCVHCLDRELADGIEDSVFVKLLQEMEEMEEKWRC